MARQMNSRVLTLFPRPIITPVLGALALVIGLTGSLLFFHLGEGLFKGMHEWLGLFFVAVMIIHMLSNWNALKKYFNEQVARLGVISVLLVTGVFLGSSAFSQQSGPNVVFKALGEAPVAVLAQLFQVDETQLIQALNGRGVEIAESSQSLQESAATSDSDNREALRKLIASVATIQQKQ